MMQSISAFEPFARTQKELQGKHEAVMTGEMPVGFKIRFFAFGQAWTIPVAEL